MAVPPAVDAIVTDMAQVCGVVQAWRTGDLTAAAVAVHTEAASGTVEVGDCTDGYGTKVWLSGRKRGGCYTGHWKSGKYHGHGRRVWPKADGPSSARTLGVVQGPSLTR